MIVTLACLLASASARADGDAVGRADRLFKEGRHAAEQHDYARACRLFEDSFRLDPGVGTLINLGDCAEHLGDLEHAYGYYRTAYARMSETDDRAPHLRERIDNIEQHAAKVALHLDPGSPEGTVVTVDGQVIANREAPLHLAKGTHVVLVTAVGYRGMRYNVDVGDGEIRVLHVTPGVPLEEELPTLAPARASAARPSTSWTRPVGIAAMGVGLAGIWVGSLAGVMAIDRRDVQRAGCDASNACTPAGLDAAREGSTWATVSTASFIAGGAVLALGATLFVVSLTSRSKSVAAALGPASFVLRGSFD